MTDRELIAALLALVNGVGVLPVTAKIDNLAAEGDAASLQQLPGTRWLERYIDGSGITATPFAVLLRTEGTDTAGRLDAAATLLNLADALEAAAITDPMTDLRGEDTPSLIERNESGDTEVWRATFVLESVRRVTDRVSDIS